MFLGFLRMSHHCRDSRSRERPEDEKEEDIFIPFDGNIELQQIERQRQCVYASYETEKKRNEREKRKQKQRTEEKSIKN